MRWVASVIAAIAVVGLTGCQPGPSVPAPGRPQVPAATMAAPIPPSVKASGCSTWETRPGPATALVHVRTTLQVGHARAPQAGVPGLVTVSSIDVVFIAGGAPVGWAAQATPQAGAVMVTGNGARDLTAMTSSIYLTGQWAPRCRVQRVYWLPGDHS